MELLKKIHNFLMHRNFILFCRSFFAVLFLFFLISWHFSEGETRDKFLLSQVHCGLVMLMSDSQLSKKDRWFNRD